MSVPVWAVSQGSGLLVAWFPAEKLAEAQELAARLDAGLVHPAALEGEVTYLRDVAVGPETILVKC